MAWSVALETASQMNCIESRILHGAFSCPGIVQSFMGSRRISAGKEQGYLASKKSNLSK